MLSRGVSELRRLFEQDHRLRVDQRYREKCFHRAVLGNNTRVLYGEKLEGGREKYMRFDLPELDHRRPFYHEVVKKDLLHLQAKVAEHVLNFIC